MTRDDLFGADLIASNVRAKIDMAHPMAQPRASTFAWTAPEKKGIYWHAERVGEARGGIMARIFRSAISGRLVLVIEWPARTGFPVAEYTSSIEAGMAQAEAWLPRLEAHLAGREHLLKGA